TCRELFQILLRVPVPASRLKGETIIVRRLNGEAEQPSPIQIAVDQLKDLAQFAEIIENVGRHDQIVLCRKAGKKVDELIAYEVVIYSALFRLLDHLLRDVDSIQPFCA